MSNHTHKSAAVPFVNQKGERSMKRVKVARYFAGKRPAYANEEEEEEEEYVTDDEYDPEDDQCATDEEYDDEEEDYQVATTSRKLDHLGHDSSNESGDDERADDHDEGADRREKGTRTNEIVVDSTAPTEGVDKSDDNDSEEEEDPRFRRLKQIESKINKTDLINVQRTHQIHSKYELATKCLILDEDDDEEEIRQRHAIARRRKLEEPLGPQAVLASSSGQQADLENADNDEDDDYDLVRQAKRLDTDDILKDLKLTGITRPSRERHKTDEEREAEKRRLKDMLELAKQEATLVSQTYKKVEEDIRKELEREALAKGDIGAREMSSVVTDDEDEELAYEEWKFREIKRVQRDRSERMLLLAQRAR